MKLLVCVFMLAIGMLSCKHQPLEPEVSQLEMVDNSCSENLSFSEDIAPILASTCAFEDGCHGGDHSWGNYLSYDGVVEKIIDGDIQQRLGNGSMPPDYSEGPYPIGLCERTKILEWINNGYPNN